MSSASQVFSDRDLGFATADKDLQNFFGQIYNADLADHADLADLLDKHDFQVREMWSAF